MHHTHTHTHTHTHKEPELKPLICCHGMHRTMRVTLQDGPLAPELYVSVRVCVCVCATVRAQEPPLLPDLHKLENDQVLQVYEVAFDSGAAPFIMDGQNTDQPIKVSIHTRPMLY